MSQRTISHTEVTPHQIRLTLSKPGVEDVVVSISPLVYDPARVPTADTDGVLVNVQTLGNRELVAKKTAANHIHILLVIDTFISHKLTVEEHLTQRS